MPSSLIFPILEVEGEVQVNDKTRLSAVKSFMGQGGSVASAITIKPELTATAISVFDATTQDNWYLDWMYTAFTTDIDATNNAIDFAESSGAAVVGLVAAGTYTLTQLAAAIKTAMQAVSPGSLTYTVTFDAQNKCTISTTAPLSLFPEYGITRDTQILKHIGFTRENKYIQRNSLTGFPMEYVSKIATCVLSDSTAVTPLTQTVKAYLHVYSFAGDYLWSTDSQLAEHEPLILKYVRDGRATFMNQHRLAQKEMLRWLDRKGYVDVYNDPFTKWSLPKIDELLDWSKFTALRLIYSGLVVQKDDIFDKKSLSYKGMEVDCRNRAVLRLDVDGDGKVDTFENLGVQSATVVRR